LFNKQLGQYLHVMENHTESFHLVAAYEGNDLGLMTEFEKRGVAVHPLSKCYVADPQQGIILGYSCVNKGFMPQFINKMGAVFKQA
jgi:DNA-binding transcriptional MocR family regulator